MLKYQKGKIYKIISNNTDKVYYGSTVSLLCRRKAQHNYDFKNNLNFLSCREIINNEHWDLVLVEDYPCEKKEQLLMRERYYIENNDCINKTNPIISKEERKIYENKYNKKNREKQKAKQHIYYPKRNEKITCECGSVISRTHKSRHLKSLKHNDYLNKV
tara:strand:+ start:77 stop:556 length:480 start_codon:yes stop_codon:yes gene_type:complete